jgi:cysteine synthase
VIIDDYSALGAPANEKICCIAAIVVKRAKMKNSSARPGSFSMEHKYPVQKLGCEVGNTPLQTINLTIQGMRRTIHWKLERLNPTQSMKDRTAYALIQALDDQGKLCNSSTVVESTSGNLGVAMARLCQLKGYKFLAVVDPKTTVENLAKLQTFGAQVHIVTHLDKNGGYILSRLAYIQRILAEQPGYIWTNQYDNPANPLIHYRSTGPEIYEQMQRHVDAVLYQLQQMAR